jgi:hypothetical protein
MEQKWYNSLESLLNANEGEDGKYYKLSGLDDKAARVASYTIGFEGLLNKTSLVVFCLFVAGSGRVNGRDFTECQDRGPPFLWGMCWHCIQGSLWADRGCRSGKGLIPVQLFQPAPCVR